MAQELNKVIGCVCERERYYYNAKKVDAVLAEKDKEIAELKAQKAQTEDDCAYWKTMAQKNAADNAVMAKQRAEALKRESRHKYKRCLAMAKWCNYFANYWECCEPPDCVAFIAKAKFHRKWYNRWRKLAEKFKGERSNEPRA